MPSERPSSPSHSGLSALTLPVIRPIPARTLVAGLSVVIFLVALFSFLVEVPRREYMRGRLQPVGGEVRLLALRSGVVSALPAPGTVVRRGDVVGVIQEAPLSNAESAHGVSGRSVPVVSARQELKALTNSVVLVNVATNGSTVLVGQLLSVLAAQDAPMQAVLYVPTHALSRVQPGQIVQMRLAAYPFESEGAVQAVIERLELTALPDADVPDNLPHAVKDTYYKATARILLAPGKGLDDMPQPLLSGMKVEASVDVERRTLLAWVVWPLLKQFN